MHLSFPTSPLPTQSPQAANATVLDMLASYSPNMHISDMPSRNFNPSQVCINNVSRRMSYILTGLILYIIVGASHVGECVRPVVMSTGLDNH